MPNKYSLFHCNALLRLLLSVFSLSRPAFCLGVKIKVNVALQDVKPFQGNHTDISENSKNEKERCTFNSIFNLAQERFQFVITKHISQSFFHCNIVATLQNCCKRVEWFRFRRCRILKRQKSIEKEGVIHYASWRRHTRPQWLRADGYNSKTSPT